MKKLLAYLLVVSILSGSVAVGLLSTGCSTVVKVVGCVLCVLDLLKVDYLPDFGGDPVPDDEYDPWVFPCFTCDGAFLKVAAAGEMDRPAIVWAALERGDELVSFSSGISTDSGSFAGDFLYIPIGGLDLDTSRYDISLYATEQSRSVGDPGSSFARAESDRHFRFTESTVARSKSYTKVTGGAKWDVDACLFVGGKEQFKVKYQYNTYGERVNLEIVTGYSSTSSDVQWSLTGSSTLSGIIDQNGYFTATYPAPFWGDLAIVASDTSTVDGVQYIISDTLGIIIDPDTAGGCSQVKKHAQVWYYPPCELSGASAHITHQFPKLCNQLDTTVGAAGVAWISVCADTMNGANTLIWAQCGYGTRRLRGSYAPFYTLYLEVFGGDDPPWQRFRIPGESSVPPSLFGSEYHLELVDATKGKWSLSVDGSFYFSFSDSAWQNQTGRFLVWSGEILNHEDDMPGIPTDTCYFTQGMMKNVATQNWEPVDFRTPGAIQVKYIDTTEWHMDTTGSQSAFLLDMNPR